MPSQANGTSLVRQSYQHEQVGSKGLFQSSMTESLNYDKFYYFRRWLFCMNIGNEMTLAEVRKKKAFKSGW